MNSLYILSSCRQRQANCILNFFNIMSKNSKNHIIVKGARVHNLKNINVEIPRDKFVVITGLSGSGKSSLAFDTIYAEGQRRYVESLSAYARQFIGTMDKPDVDSIDGLSPAISIDQKTAPHNPRSSVGTVTEIYDYMRLLFARIGKPHCPECGKPISQYTIDEIVQTIYKQYSDQSIIILSPIIKDKKGEHKNLLPNIEKAGFSRIIIDKIKISETREDRARLSEAIENALNLSDGLVSILGDDNKTKIFSQLFACPDCGISIGELEPRNFSFNSPHGACEECSGLGTKLEIDSNLIIN